MHCVSVTYRVSGLPDEELREAFAAAVPAIRAVPGLGLKLWLADPDERAFGGVYVFESAQAADDYLDSPSSSRPSATTRTSRTSRCAATRSLRRPRARPAAG